jgi:hypothetical protein
MNIQEATAIALTEEDRSVLEGMVRSPKTEQRLVERAQGYLKSPNGRALTNRATRTSDTARPRCSPRSIQITRLKLTKRQRMTAPGTICRAPVLHAA